jgi:hypothetical protein
MISIVATSNFYSHQQCLSSLSLHFCYNFLLFAFLLIAILTGWDSILVFPLWLKNLNISHLFIGHLYFFWELSVQFICLLINWIISSFGVFLSSLSILDINPLSDEYLSKILSHSVGCLFTLVIVSFAAEAFYFDAIPFVNSCSYYLGDWSPIQKIIAGMAEWHKW